MDKHRNITLDLVRVIGMVFIMFIHAPGSVDPAVDPVVFFLKGFLASGAVPVFFILSGYLGARRINSASLGFPSYIQEKFRTLVIPLLFWNSLLLAAVFTVKFFGLDSMFRGQGAYFDNDLSFSAFTTDLTGIGWDPLVRGRTPIVYQFWFIRDLIVVSITAFAIVRYLPKIPLLAWMTFFLPIPMASSLGFYLLGHQLHSVLPSEDFPSPRLSVAYCVAWIFVGCALTNGVMSIPFPFKQLGSAAFIFGLAILASRCSFTARLAVLGPAVFFVFTAHEPTQTIISKIWMASRFPGFETPLSLLAITAITFIMCVTAYFLIRKMTPRLLAFATGGRA